jgi:glycerate kinase
MTDAATRVICAPASFKGTLSAVAVAAAMARGISAARRGIEAVCCAIGDGGEGTLEAIASALGGVIHRARVCGPLGESIVARYAVVEATGLGIVELAEASGLGRLAPGARDPTRTTTYGTGELIRAAIAAGCSRVIVGVGGSATVDGGAGLCQALGVGFLDRHGHAITTPLTGGTLAQVGAIEPAAPPAEILVACDVDNPLCGPQGAAAVYGPQKGATPQQVEQLDAALRHFAALAGGRDDTPGAGAAGGAAYGMMTLLGGDLRRGIDLVLDAVGFAKRCRGAALVLTGEGRLDAQTQRGKAVLGVARVAAQQGVPTIAIVGDTGPGAEECVDRARGLLARYVSLTARFGRECAMREPASLVARVAGEEVNRWMEGVA